MATKFKSALVAVAVLVASASFGVLAQGPAAKKADDGKWIQLFDGKSLAGWRGYKKPDSKETFWKIENGTLTFTIGGKNGQIVGKEKKVTKFHSGKLTDPWQKDYSDALGADYPANATDKMSIALDMEFEIKCVSSDGQSISRRFKIQGSVDAQAATKGAKPTLTGSTITFTPLG